MAVSFLLKVHAAFARHQGDNALLPEDYICSESRCISEWNGRLLYRDSSHFTVKGAEYSGARVDKVLRNFFLSSVPAAKRRDNN